MNGLQMIDLFFRRGNPTNRWERTPELNLKVELFGTPAVNGIAVGSLLDNLSFLGRSSSNDKTPLDYSDLGFSVDSENDGTFSGFQIVQSDPEGEFAGFAGTLTLNNSEVKPNEILAQLGTPFWVDTDETETISFFEFRTHEIQICQSPSGVIQRTIVTSFHLMGDPEQRRMYGVTEAWPPF